MNQGSAQAQDEARNGSHELRDFIVLPSSVWASHRNELRQEQAACKQAALARAPGDDTKSVLGIRFRTTRRSRGGAARGGGTPSSTSKAPGSSARRRTFLCTFTTLHKVRIRPSLTQPASDATQQGPLFGGTSLKHVAHSAGSRCRLSLALVRAASALLHRDRGAHPDTQCAVCRRTTATARSDAVKTACDHKDGQLSRTPYALQHAPGALPDAQQALRHHAYVFVMEID